MIRGVGDHRITPFGVVQRPFRRFADDWREVTEGTLPKPESTIVVRMSPGYPVPAMPTAPHPFDGIWYHSQDANTAKEILQNGWNPEHLVSTMYGCAVYLARAPGWNGRQKALACCLLLSSDETATDFGTTNTQDDFLQYLDGQVSVGGVVGRLGRNPQRGNSSQNRAIRDFFLGKSVRAVHFLEHGSETVVVYDPTCIRLLGAV